jgi:hypothetical protein
MVIAAKPKRAASDAPTPDPMQFIEGAENWQKDDPAVTRAPMQKRRKEPVIIRFDEKTLSQIDQAAAKRGLSRAALVRMLVIEHLPD